MMKPQETKDYGADGVDIQTAKLLQAKAYPDPRTRPGPLLWNGQEVWTHFELRTPKTGRLRLEFLSDPIEPMQGFDVKVESGAIELLGGERVQLLRTWNDDQYESSVEYPYRSESGLIRVWNVYKRQWFNGEMVDEKWTGNAGFLVSRKDERTWLFRCSDGSPEFPVFSRLVVGVSILGES